MQTKDQIRMWVIVLQNCLVGFTDEQNSIPVFSTLPERTFQLRSEVILSSISLNWIISTHLTRDGKYVDFGFCWERIRYFFKTSFYPFFMYSPAASLDIGSICVPSASQDTGLYLSYYIRAKIQVDLDLVPASCFTKTCKIVQYFTEKKGKISQDN